MNLTLNQHIKNFFSHLADTGQVSDATINNYKFYLSRFTNLLDIKTLEEINITAIAKFRYLLGQMRNQRGELMKLATQNYHLIAIRVFLNYLDKHGLAVLNSDKIVLHKTSRKNIKSMGKVNMERLLEVPLQTKNPSIIQKRDKAVLELLLSSGLKVSELAALKTSQINFLHDSLTIKGMGSRLRTVELSNHAKYWLKKYLEARTDSLPALFIRHDKAKAKQLKTIDIKEYQLTPRTVQRIIKKYVRSAELDSSITPQTLRNSYAEYLYEKGEDIKSIQSKLGHASVITTHLYTRH